MSSGQTRREFAKTVATAALAAPLATACASLTSEPPAAPPPRTPPPTATPAPAVQAEIEALQSLARAKFGAQLDSQQMETVLADVKSVVERAERLRAIPLPNALEPSFVFPAFRAEG